MCLIFINLYIYIKRYERYIYRPDQKFLNNFKNQLIFFVRLREQIFSSYYNTTSLASQNYKPNYKCKKKCNEGKTKIIDFYNHQRTFGPTRDF